MQTCQFSLSRNVFFVLPYMPRARGLRKHEDNTEQLLWSVQVKTCKADASF
ncbi:hypothetical protein K0M31_002091 [Melipona bicolor]|uniref:Uncharacterized protein n=1 Tax=Melipona bicolor TaxID=60889 RepID=A0AA40GH17_9HYME|nr:hypothetical protein K0M31_002091 [Melipona bicolor]